MHLLVFHSINTVTQKLRLASRSSRSPKSAQVPRWPLCLVTQVFDQSALSTEAKEEMYKLYPNARRAHLKTGGNFPYLCRSAEVNLYIQVSLCIPAQSATCSARAAVGDASSALARVSEPAWALLALAPTSPTLPRSWRASVGLGWAHFLHDFILTKIPQKGCFSFIKPSCFYACFSVVFPVLQIHLLQFHGTRYAAIDPSMVSAEELEVQKISLHTSSEQEEQ